MGIPFKSHLATRQVNKLAGGNTATITQYAEDTQDISYGDFSYIKTNTTITVVLSFITNTREPFDRKGELGHYFNMHVEFFTADTLPSGIGDPVDKAPTLAHGGHDYEVMDVEVAQNGLSRLLCYRKRV